MGKPQYTMRVCENFHIKADAKRASLYDFSKSRFTPHFGHIAG